MPRHNTFLSRARDTVESFRNPAPPQVRANPRSTPFAPSNLLDNFRFNFGNAGPEFSNTGLRRRNRPATFDEMRERFGREQIGQFNAIAAGTGFRRGLRDPVTGQLSGRIDPRTGKYIGGTEEIPSFNISPNTVNQQAAAQRQQLAAGAAGVAGNRLGPRSGGAITPAINQGFGASFAGQSVALNDLQRTNIQTRLFGVQGQQDLIGQFRAEAGQRPDIRLTEDSLRLGLEKLKVGKEGQDLQAALEKQRLGILAFSAREQAAMNAFNRWLDEARLQFDIDKENKKGGLSIGRILNIVGRAAAAYITAGASEAVLAASDAIGQGNERDFIRNPDPR